MDFTAYDSIRLALLDIGAIAKSEVMSADESADALKILNMLLGEWAAQGIRVTATVMENFTLTANDGSYTIGVGKDFNTSKPLKIVEAYTRDSNNSDRGLRVVTLGEWNSYGDKATAVGPPESLYYDPGATQQAVQTGTINIYPKPDSGTTYTLYIGGHKLLTEFAAVSDAVTFPKPYLRALRLNLAVDLWPSYYHEKGDPVPLTLKAEARRAMAVIEAMNSTQQVAGIEIPSGQGYPFNIYTGE